MLTIENEFWDTVTVLFQYGGSALRTIADFNYKQPLASKKVGEGQL
jgi:hypothetical protein